MKKISLFAIRETTVFSEKEKVELLVKGKLLNETWCKEQVFKLAATFFAKLDQNNQNAFLDAIDEEYNTEEELDEYGLYNWYVWLKRIDAHNNRINDLVEQYHMQFGYEPREFPEKIMYSSSERWSDDISPYTEEALLHMPLEKIVSELTTYEENNPFIPNRRGLLSVFSKCCKNNVNWATNVLSELVAKNVFKEDVWQYYFYGIYDAECNIDTRINIINIIVDYIENVSNIKGLSEFVLQTIRQNDLKNDFKKYEKQLCIALEKIWERRKMDSFDFPRLIDASLNTITGVVIMSWVYLFSYVDEKTMPKEYKDFFENALKLSAKERRIAICILAGHFNLFCIKDREWSMEKLMPLLTDGKRNNFTAAWEGIVVFSRWISAETSDVWNTIYLKAIKHFKYLTENTKGGFLELLVLLMIYYMEKPTTDCIPELYKNIANNDRKVFIRKIRHRLSDMDERNKRDWWDKWLKKFLENRKKNKPCLLEDSENQEIFMLLPELGEVFEEASEVISMGAIPNEIDDLLWFNLNNAHIASKYPESMYKLVIVLLNVVDNLGIGEDSIKDIIKEMGTLDAKKRRKLENVLLKHNINL